MTAILIFMEVQMRLVILSLTFLFLTSCASILSGKQQDFTVNSNVSGAKITLNGQSIGTTPYVGKIARSKEGAILEVSKPGYATKKYALKTKVNGFFWVNILSGGVFGSSTDYSTGAMFEYAPGVINVDLEKK